MLLRKIILTLAAMLALGAQAGCGSSGSDTSVKQAAPRVTLATKKSLTHCLTAAGVHVDPSANLIGSKLEFQGLGIEYVGTVSFAGGSFGALWVGASENQTDAVRRVKEISQINSTGPSLNPDPATLDYFWDFSRNILFAIPASPQLHLGDPIGKKFDQCLRTG